MDGVGWKGEGRERKHIKGEVRDGGIKGRDIWREKKYKREHNHLHDD